MESTRSFQQRVVERVVDSRIFLFGHHSFQCIIALDFFLLRVDFGIMQKSHLLWCYMESHLLWCYMAAAVAVALFVYGLAKGKVLFVIIRQYESATTWRHGHGNLIQKMSV